MVHTCGKEFWKIIFFFFLLQIKLRLSLQNTLFCFVSNVMPFIVQKSLIWHFTISGAIFYLLILWYSLVNWALNHQEPANASRVNSSPSTQAPLSIHTLILAAEYFFLFSHKLNHVIGKKFLFIFYSAFFLVLYQEGCLWTSKCNSAEMEIPGQFIFEMVLA